MNKEFFRRVFLAKAALGFILFICIGIGWLGTQLYRDVYSPKVAYGEYTHAWKSYGSTLYITAPQKFWLQVFDSLSDWCLTLVVLTFLGWFGFVALRDP